MVDYVFKLPKRIKTKPSYAKSKRGNNCHILCILDF